MNKSKLISVGKIVKAFGLRGELKVHPLVLFEDFLNIKNFIVLNPKGGKKTLTLENIRLGAGNTLILKFKNIDSRDLAEKLKGHELLVYEEELPNLKKDEYYIKDLLGCKVMENETLLGEVIDFLTQAVTGSLVIRTKDDKIVYVPFAERYVKSVSIERKEIQVVDFKELEDINP